MPLDEFLTTAEALRPSGYRPVRFRPYADGPAVNVAAVWTRDGRKLADRVGLWRPRRSASSDERNRQEQFLPVDVAGYVATDRRPAGRPLRRALGREPPAATMPGCTSGRPTRPADGTRSP